MYLNLSNKSKSQLSYKINKYPDGQQDIELLQSYEGEVTIVSRFNSFLDLELIICAVKALHRLCIYNVNLYIPYLLGARSDRIFKNGGVSYLRDVVSPILNSLGLSSIQVFDVHNGAVADACINNLYQKTNSELVEFAMTDIGDNFIIVSPDEGASKKIDSLSKSIGYNREIILCTKKRDLESGKIIDTNIGSVVDFKGQDIAIIDDICDGGRTFIEIAKKIRLLNPGKIYLVVSHGIFSSGFVELCKYFDAIYCTNSIRDIDTVNSEEYNFDIPIQKTDFVKQLKIV